MKNVPKGFEPSGRYPCGKKTEMIPEYTRLNRFGADCHLLKLDPARFRFQVTNIGFKTVSQAAAATGAEIVVNGDGWGLPRVARGKPNSICYSDGRAIQTRQYETRPWINFSRNFPSILKINMVEFA